MEVARDRARELCRPSNVDPPAISDASPPRPLSHEAAKDVADGLPLSGSSSGQPARSGCPSVAVEIPYGSPTFTSRTRPTPSQQTTLSITRPDSSTSWARLSTRSPLADRRAAPRRYFPLTAPDSDSPAPYQKKTQEGSLRSQGRGEVADPRGGSARRDQEVMCILFLTLILTFLRARPSADLSLACSWTVSDALPRGHPDQKGYLLNDNVMGGCSRDLRAGL